MPAKKKKINLAIKGRAEFVDKALHAAAAQLLPSSEQMQHASCISQLHSVRLNTICVKADDTLIIEPLPSERCCSLLQVADGALAYTLHTELVMQYVNSLCQCP